MFSLRWQLDYFTYFSFRIYTLEKEKKKVFETNVKKNEQLRQ